MEKDHGGLHTLGSETLPNTFTPIEDVFDRGFATVQCLRAEGRQSWDKISGTECGAQEKCK